MPAAACSCLGVTDGGEVPGMSRERLDALERLVGEICRDSIKPAIRVQAYRSEVDQRSFLLVSIPEGHAQHDSPGGGYVRVGSSKVPMGSDERMRLAQRRGQARFTGVDEQTVAATGFATLDEQLWKPLLSTEGLADPLLGLEKLGLLATDEHGATRATVAGVLACTENPEQYLPNAVITAVRYRGTDRASGQIDAQEISGPINGQIRQALAFATRNMRVGARKVSCPRESARIQRTGAVRGPSERGRAPRLLDQWKPHPAIDLLRPARTSLTRRSPEQSHDREHGRAAIDSE